MIRKYTAVWLRMASMSLQGQLSYPLGSVGFFLGKMIRLVFFFAFVVAIFSHTESLAGYSLVETALFFLTYNLVDMTAQIFFRGIYGARRTVADGDFDFYLVQPCSPLFRMVFTSVDFLDIATILPVLATIGVVFWKLPQGPDFLRYALYALLTVNGVVIAMTIHIFVAGLAVRTQELENTIWIYRDIMFMGKFPTDIYASPARWVLTFIVPIAVMVTFPAKALLGLLSPAWTLYAFALSLALLLLSRLYWLGSLRRYTSSSS
jgi:ABC-2 type transport system permease protein